MINHNSSSYMGNKKQRKNITGLTKEQNEVEDTLRGNYG